MDVELRERDQSGPDLVGRLLTELDLLRRHVNLLREVQSQGPRGILRLSEAVNEPAHRIRYSLRLLEDANLIEATTTGAKAQTDLSPVLSAVAARLQKAAADLEAIDGEVAQILAALETA